MSRGYQLRRRAEQQAETRQRIVDAAIELHSTVGPTATTISDIAARAGVGRVTVYRHFPDELSLAQACSGHYFSQHPFPDVEAWRSVADPHERLRVAVREAHAYHAATEAMMSRALGEARDYVVMEPYHAFWASAVEAVIAGWGARGRRRDRLRAAVALALSFDTWRLLVTEQGLSVEDAVAVAVGSATSTAAG
jgi:AcrR family transcriptional regulator